MAVYDVLVSNHVGEHKSQEWTKQIYVSTAILIKYIGSIQCLSGEILNQYSHED